MSLSLRAYARHRRAAGLSGGTHQAVRAAIDGGRLTSRSLTADGKIRSAKAADAEWAASTREDRVPISGRTAPASASTATPDLQEARARREAALADIAEIERDELLGRFVEVDEAREVMMNDYTIVRTHLLAVSSKLALHLTPDEFRKVHPIVDDLIREALTQVSDRLDAIHEQQANEDVEDVEDEHEQETHDD